MANLDLEFNAIAIEATQKKIAFLTAAIQGQIQLNAEETEKAGGWLYATLSEMEALCRRMRNVLMPID